MSSTTSPPTPAEWGATENSASSDTLPSAPSVDSELDGFDSDPVVVCGFSVKFPGDADTADGLWKMIMERRCASTEFPADRTNPLGFHREKKRLNTLGVTGGHFIKGDLSRFDADFFSMSPAEAASIDPMQRWLLEAAYLALENAGIPMESVNGSATAVYTGCFSMDYTLQLARDPENAPTYAALGMSISMLANRLSWFFNLSGPSIGLDSACSSTAMAVDIACQALQGDSCDMALVAGSNLANAPEFYTWMTNINFLSKDNRCYSFDHRANGYARGEGIGVVVLKRLSKALRDGNVIRAVIRSTGSNQDGKTPGITQPSRLAQEQLIRETYQKAGLSMAHTRLFEAHGTGTAIGDPREANAIGGAFQKYRSVEEPLYIGALKSNIGHLEGASGLAGLVKATMALEKGIIPPNTNFEKVNPRIDTEYLKITFPQAPTPWPTQGLRRASVNSFGYGGANSHIVLDDAYNYLKSRGLHGRHQTVATPPTLGVTQPVSPLLEQRVDTTFSRLLVWSTADKNGKDRLMPLYKSWLDDKSVVQESITGDDFLGDLAYTLDSHRSHLPWRWSAVISSIEDLRDVQTRASSALRASAESPRIGFVFSGQGAQWPAMGRELLSYTSYREELEQSEVYLKSLGCSWSVVDELLKPSEQSSIDKAEISQTLCTILQVGLVNLFHRFGIEPSGVVGHSSGEISAAYAAGHITRESAWKIAYYRGICSNELAEASTDPSKIRGAMMSVKLTEDEAREAIRTFDEDGREFGMSLACVNSPTNMTIAGEESLIDRLKESLDSRDIFARKLRVPVAYHSRQMEAVSAKYTELIGSLDAPHGKRSVPMISSVYGQHISGEKLLDPSYWALNMTSTVQFSPAVAFMCSESEIVKSVDGSHAHTCVVDHLLEIGPHAVLQGPIRDILNGSPRGKSVKYSSAIRRGQSATDTMLSLMGELHSKGSPLNLRAVNEPDSEYQGPSSRRQLIHLPAYPFDHSQQHWHESRLSRNYRLRPTAPSELLGFRSRDWIPTDARWHHFLRISEMPWVDGHVVNDTILYPAAGMLAMVIEAAKDLADSSAEIDRYTLSDVHINAPMDLSSSGGSLEVQTALKIVRTASEAEDAYDFVVRTYHSSNDTWVVNCSGLVSIEKTSSQNSWQNRMAGEEQSFIASKLSKTISRCTTPVDSKGMYGFLVNSSYKYGPVFQGAQLQSCCEETLEASAEVKLFASTTEDHVIHPASLDAMLHICFTALTSGGARPMATSVITGFKRISVAHQGISAPGQEKVKACVSIVKNTESGFLCDGGALVGPSNEMKLWYEGLQLTNVTSVPQSTSLDASQPDPRMFCMNIDLKVALDMLESNDIASVLAAKIPSHADEPKEPSNNDDLRKLVLVTLERLTREQDVEVHGDNETWTKRFWRWAGNQLAEARKDPSWIVEDAPVHVLDQLFGDYCMRFEATSAVGQVYSEFAAQLFSILQGNVDMYSLLEQKGLLASCSAHEASTKSSAKVTAYVDLLAHHTPGMKILELKAGGESMTKTIVKALASGEEVSAGSLRCNRYEIADISSDRLEDDTLPIEHSRFSSQLKVVKINLQEILEDQSDSKSSYDLIAVSGLLWSKGNLQDDLKKFHEMLKPGGRLIVNLPAYLQSPEADFILALLPYTRAAIGEELRPSSFLDATWWDTRMLDAGFERSLVLCEDHEGRPSGTPSTLIYYATEETATQTAATPETAQQITLVIKDSAAAQETFAKGLAAVLQETLGWEVQILHLEELISHSERKPQSLVIMLVDYDPSSYLVSLNETNWALMQSLFKSSHEILWVSAGGGVANNPEHGTLDGFARTMRSEHYQLHLVTLALDIQNGSDGERTKRHPAQICKVASEMARRKSGDNYEQEYIDIDGILHTRRLVETRALKDEMDSRITQCQSLKVPANQIPFKMSNTIIPGLTQGPHYWEVPALSDTNMTSDEVDVQVRALSLHGRYQHLANNNQITEPECSDYLTGVVVRAASHSEYREGDRIVAARSGPFHSHVRLSSQSIARLPTNANFAISCVATEAAARAYHALVEVARVQPGDSVMIQDGFSPIGQAALRLLDRQGVSDVWTTVSSESEMEKLPTGLVPNGRILPQSWFSGQGASILASRWTRRFDIVLIPYADATMPLHSEHIRSGGRYIALYTDPVDQNGTQQIRNAPNNISLSLLHPASDLPSRASLQYAASSLRFSDPQNEARQHVLQFPASDIAAACKRVRSATGKEAVIVRVEDSDTIEVLSSIPNRQYLLPDVTYLIAGGLGGLGRSIARWLVRRGAKNLLLLSRSGPKTAEAQELLSELQAQDIHAEAPSCDITDRNAVRAMLDRYSKTMPPVKGCIQASMVMTERVFEQMEFKDWEKTIDPKIRGSWNLHLELPSGLDFFILTSSINGILGAGGLTAYNSGNTYEDALARYRVSLGERATSVNLGGIPDAGFLAVRSEAQQRDINSIMRSEKYVYTYVKDVCALLDMACDIKKTGNSAKIDLGSNADYCQTIIGLRPMSHWKHLEDVPATLCQPFWGHLHHVPMGEDTVVATQAGQQVSVVDVAERLAAAAQNIAQMAEVTSEALANKVASLLGFAEDAIDLQEPIHLYGLDSLTAIDVRNWVGKIFEVDMPVFEILGGATFADAGMSIARKVQSKR